MTPARFLVDPLPDTDLVVIGGPEGHHAATVRRLAPGETVVVFDGHGRTRRGTVVEVGRDRVVVRAGALRTVPTRDARLIVVQALAKGDRGELAVELLTEFGVDEIVPWQAARSIVQWRGERGEKAHRRWRRTALEAAKQSRRDRVPEVTDVAGRAGVVERITGARAAYVLHESAEVSLTDQPRPADGEIVLVVGPEGGVDDAELEAFTGAGALAVRLGPEVLRTSGAGAAAVAVLSVALGRW